MITELISDGIWRIDVGEVIDNDFTLELEKNLAKHQEISGIILLVNKTEYMDDDCFPFFEKLRSANISIVFADPSSRLSNQWASRNMSELPFHTCPTEEDSIAFFI